MLLATGARPRPPRPVDQSAQHREQTWHSVHFVQNDKLVQMAGQIGLRLLELGPVLLRFQVEIQPAQPPPAREWSYPPALARAGMRRAIPAAPRLEVRTVAA
jgi:hypothetical protein